MLEELICEDCGTDIDVNHTICPFVEEIYGKIEECTLCVNCEQSRAWDI